MKDDKSIMAGNTAMLVLKLLDDRDMYGYQMIEELERRSENVFKLKAGTLYPLLHTLEQQGVVISYEQADGARPRKYYRITGRGKTLFAEKKSEWLEFSAKVNQVLGGPNYAV